MAFIVIGKKKIKGKIKSKLLSVRGTDVAFGTKKEAEFAKKVLRKVNKRQLKGARLKVVRI